ncbi:UDP-glucose 4-epimerase GalE [Demequina sp. SYSU T00192]|uniref:UDP-glucose 4-epimerase n=1 Tax=Demequina litoralis TaxID=3051660 RepID=A0ABT8G9V8_9MICO|nr:UDP-glucose 4-epimerase GalE [Demequina sp. SYSU T00192]MDN4475918.1 UDP-glucose 4-epimerase GalE [Demequina sp. SYSU T00192]
MTWLVTGGAGYIGAHVVRALREAGIAPIVIDDLFSGVESFVPEDVPFIKASILDTDAVEAALREHDVTGVIHCAGYKYAGESVKFPLLNYSINVEGTRSLLEAMERAGVTRLVFSSSAGVYGNSGVDVVTETTPTTPESPYGESKLIGEWLIRDQIVATTMAGAPLAATSLRYFNVVGSGHADVWDASPHNLFPKVLFAIQAGKAPQVNGTDYPTPDGTCVRDYVHVSDLAAAHVVAAQRLAAGDTLEPVYNLGSGAGTSVREIVDAMVAATGTDKTPVEGPRRAGDPAKIVADGTLATRDLDWRMRYTVQEMVDSAWASHPKA